MTANYVYALHVLVTCAITFAVNLPFGYLRGRFRKFSFLWFLMIHLPVPFVVFVRHSNHVELSWKLAPFLIGSFFLGQFAGRKLYARFPIKKQKNKNS